MKNAVVGLLIALLGPGCAAQMLRPSAANDSSNSGASSGNSSGGSNNSSGQSNNSSANSNNSSQTSSNNSKGSSDSNASSKNSSDNTTADPGVQRTSATLAGAALLVTTGVGIGLTIFLVKRAHRNNETPPEQEAKEAQAWLNANLKQLKQDLALGAGPTVKDLASAAEIHVEHLSRFGQMLQAHRAELLAPTGSGHVSLQQAAQVMGRIGELTLADEVLKEDAAGWLSRHPGPG
jgi:hypothetical protein